MKKERCPYGNDKAERRVPTSGCRSQSNIADSLVNGLLMLLEPFAGLAHEMGVSYTGLLAPLLVSQMFGVEKRRV